MACKKRAKGLEQPSSYISSPDPLIPPNLELPAQVKNLEPPPSFILPTDPLTPTKLRYPALPTPTLSKPRTIRRPFNCCQCTKTSRHGGITCFGCNHQMCSECQVFSIETDIVLDPIPKDELIVETPRRQEDDLPVSANTRSAQKKKLSVLELGKLLEKSARMEEGRRQSDGGSKDS